MSLAGRLTARLRRAWPDRVVHRDVQGVRLALPWSHKLPDYAKRFPNYGQNLVAVAEAVAGVRGEPFGMVDVGANVGDSALQVLAKVDARVVCIEGDGYWLRWLHRNVDADPRIRVVPALVLPDANVGDVVAVRNAGTTHFVSGTQGHDIAPGLTAGQVRAQVGDVGRVGLVKSDTDGYDARIVPAIARAWSADHPVLFFEYDPGLTREVGDASPHAVWAELATLGYERVVVWDNFGNPIGTVPIEEAATAAAVLDQPFAERGYHYWDVAVVHRDDAELCARIEDLVGGRHGAEAPRREA